MELDNFRRLSGLGWPGFKQFNLFRQDKGHQAEISAFVARCLGRTAVDSAGRVMERHRGLVRGRRGGDRPFAPSCYARPDVRLR